MNQKGDHHQLDIPGGDLHPQILWGAAGHQAYDEHRYDDVHDHVHHSYAFAAWGRLDQHPHEG
jgi:hypothetical protein